MIKNKKRFVFFYSTVRVKEFRQFCSMTPWYFWKKYLKLYKALASVNNLVSLQSRLLIERRPSAQPDNLDAETWKRPIRDDEQFVTVCYHAERLRANTIGLQGLIPEVRHVWTRVKPIAPVCYHKFNGLLLMFACSCTIRRQICLKAGWI